MFVILLYHADIIPLTIYSDIGCGKNREMINLTEMAKRKGKEYCVMLLGIYVFTGEDVTSAFRGKGKVGPLKKLECNQKYQKAFR